MCCFQPFILKSHSIESMGGYRHDSHDIFFDTTTSFKILYTLLVGALMEN